MKSIRLLLLLASGVTTGAFAQSGGLTDMSQSRFAKMANTELGAVHWTDGFWGDRFNVYSHTSLQSMWDTWNNRLSGNFWLVSFKISYLCLPLFYETRTTPSCHPSGCAYRQL